MLEFDQVENGLLTTRLSPNDRHPCLLASRAHFDLDGLESRLLLFSIAKPNGERGAPMDHGPAHLLLNVAGRTGLPWSTPGSKGVPFQAPAFRPG